MATACAHGRHTSISNVKMCYEHARPQGPVLPCTHTHTTHTYSMQLNLTNMYQLNYYTNHTCMLSYITMDM